MKERTYKIEDMFLSPYAKKSKETAGRLRAEEPCPLRTDFQRDRDRIIHSKAFRRLKNKTQVFISPEGDHFRTRLTHTLDVSQIARSIARNLALNEDLTEAIALSHDLGHTPYGHAGERTLNTLSPDGFAHNKQSLRVVDVLEGDGKGLNLTLEVRDGILNHRTAGKPSSLEGYAVMLADKIAYVNHDIDDSIRAGFINQADLPEWATRLLGANSRERINSLMHAIIRESENKNVVSMTIEAKNALNELRQFMFDRVYRTPQADEQELRVSRMLTALYEHYMKNDDMPPLYISLLERFERSVVVCDYISSMTDRYAQAIFESLFIPKNWAF